MVKFEGTGPGSKHTPPIWEEGSGLSFVASSF